MIHNLGCFFIYLDLLWFLSIKKIFCFHSINFAFLLLNVPLTTVLFYFILTTAIWYVGVLAPQPGIKPGSPTVEAWSLNQWTAREVSPILLFVMDVIMLSLYIISLFFLVYFRIISLVSSVFTMMCLSVHCFTLILLKVRSK